MLRFKQFTDDILFETLNSHFTLLHNTKLKDGVNQHLGDYIQKGHTAAMQSSHMKDNGLSVVRIMNKNKQIEYHIHNENLDAGETHLPSEQDRLSLLHTLQIIKNDAKFHLDRGRKIKIQSPSKEHNDVYHKLTKHLIKNDPARKVTDLGLTPNLNNTANTNSFLIEDAHENGKVLFWKGFNVLMKSKE